MTIKIGNAPCSWGVRPVDDPERPAWRNVLRECAQTGYQGIELGPLGYMTEIAPAALAEALEENRLDLIGGVVYQPFSDPNKWDVVMDAAKRLCKAASAQGAPNLVLIDSISPRRQSTAGRADEAEQMDQAEWTGFRDRVATVARMASDEYGLTPCLHQHVAGFMEFEPEVERLLQEIEESILKICVDTGHFAYAGYDPLGFMKRHIDRISYVHFKDINPTVRADVVSNRTGFFEAHGQGVFCRLGDGCVDFPAVRQLLVDHNYDGWCTVEQDADPMVALSPFKDATQSREYLSSIGFL